jgi:COX assembly mitochondrial protein 1
VLIPKIMRERAKAEKCVAEVKGKIIKLHNHKSRNKINSQCSAFSDCCSNASLAMVFSCRKENSTLRSCLERWYVDEEFKKQCKDQFLRERKEFRLTGLEKKYRML